MMNITDEIMKQKLLLILGLILNYGYINSQTATTVPSLKCQYEYTSVKDSLANSQKEDLMFLIAGAKESAFYSYYTFQADSIRQEPDYEQKWKQTFLAAFQKDGASASNFYFRRNSSYIYKNFLSGKITIYDDIDNSLYCYEDSLDSQNWEVCDSIKTVLGYRCEMAKAYYHGRRWIAWFTCDIPVSNGPWKLGGLPGLILEAYDTDFQHRFVINGIQTIKTYTAYDRSKYGKFKKTTRKKFLKAKRKYEEDSARLIQARTGIDLDLSNASNVLHRDYLETDYQTSALDK